MKDNKYKQCYKQAMLAFVSHRDSDSLVTRTHLRNFFDCTDDQAGKVLALGVIDGKFAATSKAGIYRVVSHEDAQEFKQTVTSQVKAMAADIRRKANSM